MFNFLCFLIALIPMLDGGRIAPLNQDPQTAHIVPTQQGWISLEDLPEQNITLYSDALFERIKSGDLTALEEGYRSLEGTALAKSQTKTLYYPSLHKLKFEAFFAKAPFLPLLFTLYLTAALLLRRSLFLIAFCLHTFLLLGRCYILSRPPVSNMMETLLYVPWIAAFTALICGKRRTILFSGALSATCLLLFLPPHQSFETVQAVLDSSYWLIIHVMLVVGSYGIFIFAGVLAHIYLLKKRYFATLIKTLYIGTALLIAGTLLGGVWAAQSWGRFWDWDPKESWAFISALVYLAFLHAYKFRKIKERGLAIGAIIGLMAISFTWYGVNYILGTGLHSYGFGSGGEWLYYGFLAGESLFILSSAIIKTGVPKKTGVKIAKRDEAALSSTIPIKPKIPKTALATSAAKQSAPNAFKAGGSPPS